MNKTAKKEYFSSKCNTSFRICCANNSCKAGDFLLWVNYEKQTGVGGSTSTYSPLLVLKVSPVLITIEQNNTISEYLVYICNNTPSRIFLSCMDL